MIYAIAWLFYVGCLIGLGYETNRPGLFLLGCALFGLFLTVLLIIWWNQ